MAAMRGPRIPTGSAAWVADERASALQIVDVEVDEFTYAAHNEFSWLNEHMAGIFSENETNIAETFKTPGKLRGKTPRTVRKLNPTEPRVPLSDVFGGTPSSSANRLAHHLRAHSPQLQKESSIPPPSPSPRRHAPSPPKPTLPSPEKTFRIAQEDQTVNHVEPISSDNYIDEPVQREKEPAPTTKSQPMTQDSGYYGSQDINSTVVDPLAQEEASLIDPTTIDEPVTVPAESSPLRSIVQDEPIATSPAKTQQVTTAPQEPEEASPDDARSQSDGSSPIRPGFRKSSLNFPSLPAREPLTAGKSGGPRASRTSHLDFKRTSYLGRHTGGKSLGNYARQDASDEEDHDEMDVDDLPSVPAQQRDNAEDLAVHHNKTYTQMLQDRINVLGKSQPNGSRPSKSIHSLTNSQPTLAPQAAPEQPKSPSPKKLETATTPGAFPEDDDDDWIDPPAAEPASEATSISKPTLSKSHSADVMEGIHGKETVGSLGDLDMEERAKTQSPTRTAANLQRPNVLGHGKSVSVPAVPLVSSLEQQDGSPHKKTVSVSNPSVMMATVAESSVSQTPTKSPSRRFRDSPLKQVKDKLSSVLTMSKGLLISSAAASAEGKSSILSPSTTRLGLYPNLSSEAALRKPSADSLRNASPVAGRQASPSRPVAKRTRASTEREKEDKRREKEAKFQAEQMDRLEKEREKEREKVRVFSKEQEKIATMEKQLAAKKENEPPAIKTTPKATRSSPRKAKPYETEAKATDHDVDMADAPVMAPPPSASRSVGPGQSLRNKELRRPMKPGKETLAKTKQAPTVIRVNTGSQHSQFHPASSSMSASFQDHGASTSSQPKQQLASKASKASLQTKPSASALNASVGSTGRPRAIDLAAKKKEQDDREAQRRRDAKAELERKRAAAKEEKKRQEQLQRQAEEQRKREQADAKKNAQRQAAIEKAKKTPAPPPAVRTQPNGPPDYSLGLDKSSSVQRGDGPPRPPSRMNSGIHRSQEDIGRPVNAVLSTASKSGPKRPLGQDANEDGPARHAPSRGPQYQAKDAKRRRTSDEFADELDFDQPPNIKGPPVRPSSTLKKVRHGDSHLHIIIKADHDQDMHTKNMMSGYVSQNTVQTLFKTGVAQHPSQAKGGNPLDMAQIHKGAIPFAPNPNPAGPSYKTPARLGGVNGVKSVAKSAQRSSPRFQNGEAIELPEIQTDDEDEDDDDGHALTVAAWADSPDLRRALMRQEVMDPSQIFGSTGPLNMEEVFNQSKERFHKFRARTSSANWSGTDRLTEDDIRKDLAARDKLRREGGWSYELSRDMM
ncbi:hypothetical protein N0V84_003977 [Fusarium piperis]|uniref:Inner centromere protein ARK-binding domain-containing protein n=1 Tax=Fusarium piperis TaxID=1435070 RepID=A0A9W8WGR7_9HYPO|nr:hypothetical protein N0V84_003977 [Fusarium piperis]